jgi:hypothetical protein
MAPNSQLYSGGTQVQQLVVVLGSLESNLLTFAEVGIPRGRDPPTGSCFPGDVMWRYTSWTSAAQGGCLVEFVLNS